MNGKNYEKEKIYKRPEILRSRCNLIDSASSIENSTEMLKNMKREQKSMLLKE